MMNNADVFHAAVTLAAPLIAKLRDQNLQGRPQTFEEMATDELRRCFKIAKTVADEL